jgi:DNA-directed RNA polymerase subunit omega
MARVTIEDCSIIVQNRFHLVLLASNRAKEITLGAASMVKRAGEKAAVLALREIAQNLIDLDTVENIMVQKYRRFSGHNKADDLSSKEQADGRKAVQQRNVESDSPDDLLGNVGVAYDSVSAEEKINEIAEKSGKSSENENVQSESEEKVGDEDVSLSAEAVEEEFLSCMEAVEEGDLDIVSDEDEKKG